MDGLNRATIRLYHPQDDSNNSFGELFQIFVMFWQLSPTLKKQLPNGYYIVEWNDRAISREHAKIANDRFRTELEKLSYNTTACGTC